jgi:acyl-CoA synthetase (AMP-forming)/AMP-acid ligase II
MAKAAKATAGQAPARAGRKGRWAFWAFGLGTGIALGVALPTGLLLLVGLLPAAAAFASDTHPDKTTARPVLCLNLAGLLPALKALWLGGHDLRALAALLGDPWTLVLAYGAAAFGFALARTIPYGVLLVLETRAAATMKLLAERQEALREAWGEAVAEEANRLAARAASAIERKTANAQPAPTLPR